MRAPGTPTDVENPRSVAVSLNGPIFVDRRHLQLTLSPYLSALLLVRRPCPAASVALAGGTGDDDEALRAHRPNRTIVTPGSAPPDT